MNIPPLLRIFTTHSIGCKTVFIALSFQPCDKRDVRVRKRAIARKPARGSGKKCQPLLETEPCDVNNCFSYTWRFSEWGDCILERGVPCGKGRKTRVKECVRSNGRVVDLKYCEEVMYNAYSEVALAIIA